VISSAEKCKGERAASLGLRAVGLVHRPIADRRQQTTVRNKVAKQETVVRHHHVGGLGAAARAMDEARHAEIRALPTEAIMAGRRHHPPRQHTVIDLEAVHVVVFRLLDKGQQGRERRGLGLLLAGNHPHMIAIPNKTIDFP
jgi:hypothetical protein